MSLPPNDGDVDTKHDKSKQQNDSTSAADKSKDSAGKASAKASAEANLASPTARPASNSSSESSTAVLPKASISENHLTIGATPEQSDLMHLLRANSSPSDQGIRQQSAPATADGQSQNGQAHTENWNGRDINFSADGKAGYDTKRGDTLWSLARDILNHDGQQQATNHEIYEEVQKIARLNHIHNADQIGEHQHINLPIEQQPKPATASAGTTPAEHNGGTAPLDHGAATAHPADGTAGGSNSQRTEAHPAAPHDGTTGDGKNGTTPADQYPAAPHEGTTGNGPRPSDTPPAGSHDGSTATGGNGSNATRPAETAPSDTNAGKPANGTAAQQPQQPDFNPNPPKESATLSPDAATAAAKELHDALNRQGFLWTSDPDNDKVTRILQPLNEADATAVQKAYSDLYNKKDSDALVHDIQSHVSDLDYRKDQSLLERHDGRTNDAGNVMVALAQANSDSKKGNELLVNSLSTLNSAQIEQLKTDFQKNYGEPLGVAISKNSNISDSTKQAIAILENGSDKRTTQDDVKLANIALQNKDLGILQVALGGDGQAAQAARQQLQQDNTFMQQFSHIADEKHYAGRGGAITEKNDTTWAVANDILKQGHISLDTIASHDMSTFAGLFNNADNVALAARNASPTEKQQFSEGMQLVQSHATNLNPEQQASVDYYNKIHKAFESHGAREASMWEDNLLHGHDTIVSQMAKTYDTGWGPFNWGAGLDNQKVMSQVENLSQDDWNRLHNPQTGPAYLKEIQESLKTYANADQQKQIMDMLQQKAQANTFQDSQSIHRSLEQVISDNKGHSFLCFGTSYDENNILRNLNTLTPGDAQRYKNDPSFKKTVDDFFNNNANDDQKAYAHMMLDQVSATGQPPHMNPGLQVLFDKVSNASTSNAIGDIKTALNDTQNKYTDATGKQVSFHDLMNEPNSSLTKDQQQLKQALTDQVYAAATPMLTQVAGEGTYTEPENSKEFTGKYLDPLLKTGKLDPSTEIQMGLPKQGIYAELGAATPQQQKEALDLLSPQEKAIAQNAINQHGQLDLADQMRSFIVGDGTNYQDYQSALSKLNHDQLDALKSEYAKKYSDDLDNSFLSKVSAPDQQNYKDLLTTQNLDGRQDYFDNLMNQNFSGVSPDGTQLTAQLATQQEREMLQDAQAKFKTLAPEQQRAINDYVGQSMQQYKDSKEKLAELAMDTVITVAAMAAVPFTAGASASVIAAVAAGAFVAGGTIRNLGMKAIEGNDYDGSLSNITKQFAIGGTSAALNFIGPGLVGAESSLASAAVTNTMENLAKDGALSAVKEGGIAALDKSAQTTLQDGIKGLVSDSMRTGLKNGAVDQQAVDSLVAKVAANESPEFQNALKQSIQRTVSSQVTDAQAQLVATAKQEAEDYANKNFSQKALQKAVEYGREAGTNAAIGAGANVVSDLVTVPWTGQVDPKQLLESALSGAAAGATMGILIKAGGDAFTAGRSTFSGNGKDAIPADTIPVNVTKNADGTVAIDPKHNVDGLEIKHSDGSVTRVDGDKPITLKTGDTPQLDPNAKIDVNKDPNTGDITLKTGDKSVQLEKKPIILDSPTPRQTAENAIARVQEHNGVKYSYNKDGQLISTLDKNGVGTTIGYVRAADGSVQPDRIIFNNGKTTTDFTRTEDGSWSSSYGLIGKEAKINSDGSVTFTGSNNAPRDGVAHRTEVGEPRNYNKPETALDSITLRADGGTSRHFADGVQITRDADFRITEQMTSNGTKEKFGYDSSGALNRVQLGDQTYTKNAEGKWVTKNFFGREKPFADNITLYNSDGSISVTPDKSYRNKLRPDREVARMTSWVDGRTQIEYAGPEPIKVDRVPPPKPPTEEEALAARVQRGDLVKQADGSYLHRDTSGSMVHFDGKGNPIAETTANGDRLSFSYKDGALAKVEQVSRDGVAQPALEKRADGWYEGNKKLADVSVAPDGTVTKLNEDWTGTAQRPDGLKINIDSVGKQTVDAGAFNVEQARLQKLAHDVLGGSSKEQRFKSLMTDFEQRARTMQPPMSQSEMANTYYQLDRLLSNDSAVLPQSERALLAQQFLLEAGHPNVIDQGQFNTCNVTAEVQNRMVSRNPADAIRMVTDVATTGRFVTADGTIVDMREMNGILTPFREAGALNGDNIKTDGQRNFFDQIFQSTSIETYWQSLAIDPNDVSKAVRRATNIAEERAGAQYHPGDLRYELGNGQGMKSGEYIGNYSTDPPSRLKGWDFKTTKDPLSGETQTVVQQVPSESPNLQNQQIIDINKAITGRDDPPHFLTRGRQGPGQLDMQSEAQLENTLKQLKQSGNLPATVAVDTRDPIIQSNGKEGGAGGYHVINVQNIYEKDGKLYVELTNQWGSQYDRLGDKAVTASDLFRAMGERPPEALVAGGDKKLVPIVIAGTAVAVSAEAAYLIASGKIQIPFINGGDSNNRQPLTPVQVQQMQQNIENQEQQLEQQGKR